MNRTTDEWIGKTDDDPIPPRVRARVFDRCGGTCHISRRSIRPGERWDCDHIVALVNGGEHRERNLAPVLHVYHRQKTAEDVNLKSRIYRKRLYHLGIKRKGRSLVGNKNSKWKKLLDGRVIKR